MLVINRLTKAGEIKSVVLRTTEVIVTVRDGDRIVYKRLDGKDSYKEGHHES